MDERIAKIVKETRQEVRKVAGELMETRDRLARLSTALYGHLFEASREGSSTDTNALAALRTDLECVNHDSLGPAIRSLLAAADDPPEG